MGNQTSVIVFDVNETLSDMSPMADRFADVGAPTSLAKEWFAGVLRDGFALAAAGDSGAFAVIGAESLHGLLGALPLTRGLEDAVDHIMGGLRELGVHPDVVPGVRALTAAGFRLVTLTNGSTLLAETLFTDAGIRTEFEQLLSVENAPGWKPMRSAYDYAAHECRVETAQMLLVAVHPWDIHGASRAGLHTAWLNRGPLPYPGYFAAPEHTIPALTDLAGILSGP